MVSAFPVHLCGDGTEVLKLLPEARLAPAGCFEVEVQGETVAIPRRVYNEESTTTPVRHLTDTQQEMLHCWYTRHHDGRVRQRHLEQVMQSPKPWVVPFVMQLAGEYVLEILEVIGQGLGGLTDPDSAVHDLYGQFITRNPDFFARTQRRVVSYWSCYYREQYPTFETYPGSVLIEAFRAAASQHSGRPLPSREAATATTEKADDGRTPRHGSTQRR